MQVVCAASGHLSFSPSPVHTPTEGLVSLATTLASSLPSLDPPCPRLSQRSFLAS